MNNAISDLRLIEKYAPAMGGVLTTGDLRTLFGSNNSVLLHRRIAKMLKYRELRIFRRGVYVTNNYEPERLISRIYPDAYISLHTVLAQSLVVGPIPAKTAYAVRTGPAHTYKGPDLSIVVLRITKSMDFGTVIKNGIRYATPEKALLDTLYYYQKGRKPPFNIYQDFNLSRLNKKFLFDYLKQYKNPKFVQFVKGVLNGYSK